MTSPVQPPDDMAGKPPPRWVGLAILAATLAVLLVLGFDRHGVNLFGPPVVAQDLTCQMKPKVGKEDCGRVLAARQLVYGPYIQLPVGRYRVEFDLQPTGRCDYGRVHIDVAAISRRPAPLMSADFALGGHVVARADFAVGLDLAYAPFEFRITESIGDGCAKLQAVRIAPLEG